MAEHGTRTMYVHYGCRCEACCKAEHEQYLKRQTSKTRKRNYSKHGEIPLHSKSERQREYDASRRSAMKTRMHDLPRQIHWSDIAEGFGMRCAICGCEVDPSDTWDGKTGRRCFGGRYPTVDHITPLKLGGTDTFDNVQLACKRCNSAKGARVVREQ